MRRIVAANTFWATMLLSIRLATPFRTGSLRQSPRSKYGHSRVRVVQRLRYQFSALAAIAADPNSASTPAASDISPPATTPPTEPLLDPITLLKDASKTSSSQIPYPKALSPSSIHEFRTCPQSFLFQYILKLRQPANLALAKGSMCHEALERVFDLEPSDRSLDVLQNMFRAVWSEHRHRDLYVRLFDETENDTTDGTEDSHLPATRNIELEREWGQSALALLENYYRLEDPTKIKRPNPVQREVWVRAKLSRNDSEGIDPILVRGIVDRLDHVQERDGSISMRLTDYKTGKAPDLKYSPAMNAKIQSEAYEQLVIYALLLRNSNRKSKQIPLRHLRLFYLTSVREDTAVQWDRDLGATAEERNIVLDRASEDILTTWSDMRALIDQQDARLFVGCDRSFCYCHKCRPRFVPGSVWRPNPDDDDDE